ncbi:MAG TPA: TonB-dependent receptor [Gemmatimonadaceae bacterium]|jgi:TonB-dependent receptor|nr:TonB-dependent receptor [Gemmatimonadaceae bacterium]
MNAAPRSLASLAFLFLFIIADLAAAQSGGSLSGAVRGMAGDVQPGAQIHLGTSRHGALVDSSGRYEVTRIPAGRYNVRVTKLGFTPDTATIEITDGMTTRFDARLLPAAEILGGVVVKAQRLGESQAAALERRASAPNVVTVLSGDAIRALPTLNAAEAAGRISGVTTERDEGEGKYVQIRGTEPRLSNVTINGAHVPGTQAGSRIPKLDDIPSDILAAIEVSKTLTAEQDADAIGGSVNLVTKTPEGRPQGYIASQYGQMPLLSRNQYQGGFAYGGRFGEDGKLGLLIGGSADRNNRAINDLEPAWNVDSTGRTFPVEWSQRDYLYRRNRYGVGSDIDYRFTGGSTLYLKGLYSFFENFGTTYVNDVAINATGSAFGPTGDSLGVGSHGFGTGAEITREAYNRTPRETMYGFTMGGSTRLGSFAVKASANIAGTAQHERDYRFSPFVYDGPGGQGLTVSYDASNTKIPTFKYLDPAMASAANTPSNFMLTNYFTNDGNTNGYDDGGALDLSAPWQMGDNSPAVFRFGVKMRDERKDFTSNRASFTTSTPFAMSGAGVGVSDPNYYSDISSAFTLGVVPDHVLAAQYENTHVFQNSTNADRNALASFRGSEKVYAGYVSNTVSAGGVEAYLGLRVENTHSSYLGHVQTKDASGAASPVREVPGSQTYTDLFPSVQLKLNVAEGTDARIAVTRGIARPDYSQLAPSLKGSTDLASRNNPSALSAGNPDLKPQHAWNYDLLVEHFFPSVGVLSGGVFYKQLTDVILTRQFTYNGPVTELVGFQGTRPENGGSGHMIGAEAEWQQRLTFLPGVARGLGFDLNYTHVNSSVLVDATGRTAPLARQSPNLGNAALIYELGPISARGAWAYQGANIVSYGDGLADGLGDTYFYAHSQIDASLLYSVSPRVQLQIQGLNLNNAVFGFFQGAPGHDYAIQREYYGRTLYMGAKYGL